MNLILMMSLLSLINNINKNNLIVNSLSHLADLQTHSDGAEREADPQVQRLRRGRKGRGLWQEGRSTVDSTDPER